MHVIEVASLNEGEWLLQSQLVSWRGNGPYRSGQFKGGRMVKLQKWSV